MLILNIVRLYKSDIHDYVSLIVRILCAQWSVGQNQKSRETERFSNHLKYFSLSMIICHLFVFLRPQGYTFNLSEIRTRYDQKL